MIEQIRNIAIIAHVDHGKTTLVDQLLRQSGTLDAHAAVQERVMDSNELERERGITILAKNTALQWKDYRINIIDTPGHADFGGEVERVLSMADSVLLLVDAVDGPMPQTRFVTQKALARGFRPVVVINKIDRPGARPDWVLDRTFDLFDRLGANHDQLDFPVVYTSAIYGYSSLDPLAHDGDMQVLFETIVSAVPPPKVNRDGPFQMQISSLVYNSYVGVIGIGRISRGAVKTNSPVTVIDQKGQSRPGRVLKIYKLLGLERFEIAEATAGDIVANCGIEDLGISETICAQNFP
ncbi:MAG: typA, partial [Gammaproteobacteria bacterium]|nr:typA [Gammaproteobacteria bacterium]